MSKKSKYLQKVHEHCAIIFLQRIAQKELEMCEVLGSGIIRVWRNSCKLFIYFIHDFTPCYWNLFISLSSTKGKYYEFL